MISPKRIWQTLLLAGAVDAAKWTITSVYVQTVTTYTYTARYVDRTEITTSPYTRNVPITLKPSVTLTATPISEYTSTSSSSYYDGDHYVYADSSEDIVYIRRYYPSGVIPTSVLTSSTYQYNQRDYTSTYYIQMIEFTAPTSCPTPFTFTSTSRISVPSQVTDQVSIQSASTSITTRVYDDGDAYTYTYVTATLASTSHPSGAAATTNYYYRAYITDCINPGPSSTTSSRRPTSTGSSGGSGNGNVDGDDINQAFNVTSRCAWSNCGDFPYWGIIVVTVLPAVFLLGFLESYYWFNCLMSGKGALRVGTVSWILLCLPVIFLTRRIPARDAEDTDRLRAQWKEQTFGQRLSLWRQWGLRYRYPMELLGAHPTYTYGNPAADEKTIDDWYGENGDRPQVPATYMYQHAARGMQMAPPETQEVAPQLPPRARLANRNSRSIPPESQLASVPEESGSSGIKGKAKAVQEEAGPGVGQSDPQVGRAPRMDDDEEDSAGATAKDSQPKDKDNS